MHVTSKGLGGLRPWSAVLISILALAGLAACGDDDESSDKAAAPAAQTTGAAPAAEKPAGPATPITVVHLKGQISFAAMQLGLDKGIFEKNGIDLTLEPTNNPATAVPRVVSNEIQAAQFTYGSLPVFAAADLPLLAVAATDVGPSATEDDFQAIAVAEGSGITSVKQLAGKTIGLNTVGGMSELQVRMAAKKAGIDYKSIKVVAIPYPNQEAALRAKRVDAINVQEPWLTKISEEFPLRRLQDTSKIVMENLPLSNVIMSKKFIAENADTVRKFQLGVAESMTYAGEHIDELRALFPEYSSISEEVAKKMALVKPSPTVDVAKVQEVADLQKEYGLLKEAPDVKPFIQPGPS